MAITRFSSADEQYISSFYFSTEQKKVIKRTTELLSQHYGIKNVALDFVPSDAEIGLRGVEESSMNFVLKTIACAGYI